MMVRSFALFLSLIFLSTLAAVSPQTSGADPSFYQGFIVDLGPKEIPPGETSQVRLRVQNTGVSASFQAEITQLPGPWFIQPGKTAPTFIANGRTGDLIFNITPNAGAAPVPQNVSFRLTVLVNDDPFQEKFLDNGTFQITPVAVPGAFTLISPAEFQSGIRQPFTFRWNPSSQATAYTLRVWASEDGQPVGEPGVFESITGTSFTFPEDFRIFEGGGEVYFWNVTSWNSQGTRENTEGPIPFQMFVTEPPQPFEMVQPSVDDQPMPTRPRFEWTTSQNATLYAIYIYGEENGLPVEPALQVHEVEAPASSYELPDDLAPGRYWVTIGGFNRGGVVSANPQIRPFYITSIGGFNLLEPAPEAQNVSPSPTFRWTMAENVLGYRLEIAHEFTTGWEVLPPVSLSAFDTSHTWRETPLLSGREYWWRIVAVTSTSERPNDGGWRPFRVSPLGTFRSVAPYAEEQAVALRPLFAWQAATGAQNYQVQIAPELGGAPNENQIQTSPNLPADARQWQSTLAELVPNSRYYFRVRATVNGAQRFSEEGWVPFNTTRMTPFALVSPANNATNVSRTPFLQWQPVTGATGYRVHMKLVGIGTLPPVEITTNTTSLTWDAASPLSPAAQYEWTVEAIHPDESRFANAPFRFTTQNRTSLPNQNDVIDALLGRQFLSPIDRLQLGIPSGRAISVEDVIPYTN